MRGLKQVIRGNVDSILVASFTDAWIETTHTTNVRPKRMSHLLQMRGLKQRKAMVRDIYIMSHLLQMRGLKLKKNIGHFMQKRSHLLQMRGLKPSPGGLAKKILRRIFYRCVD